jgi:hypothetical protein
VSSPVIFQLSFCNWSMHRTIDSDIDSPRLPVEMPLPPDSNEKHAYRKAPFQRTSPSNLTAGTTRGKSREINIAINRSAHALVVETELENHWTARTDLHYASFRSLRICIRDSAFRSSFKRSARMFLASMLH